MLIGALIVIAVSGVIVSEPTVFAASDGKLFYEQLASQRAGNIMIDEWWCCNVMAGELNTPGAKCIKYDPENKILYTYNELYEHCKAEGSKLGNPVLYLGSIFFIDTDGNRRVENYPSNIESTNTVRTEPSMTPSEYYSMIVPASYKDTGCNTNAVCEYYYCCSDGYVTPGGIAWPDHPCEGNTVIVGNEANFVDYRHKPPFVNQVGKMTQSIATNSNFGCSPGGSVNSNTEYSVYHPFTKIACFESKVGKKHLTSYCSYDEY